ncbi:hypothetical protein ACU4GD_07395, partial [Cupriavidus basilensis]
PRIAKAVRQHSANLAAVRTPPSLHELKDLAIRPFHQEGLARAGGVSSSLPIPARAFLLQDDTQPVVKSPTGNHL